MAKQAESYTANFAHVRDMNREQAKLETEVLDVVGQQMTDGFSAVLAGASKAGNTDLAAAGGRRAPAEPDGTARREQAAGPA